MKHDYPVFINQLQERISDLTGYDPDSIRFDGGDMPSPEDRISVDLPERFGIKEAVRLHASSLFNEYLNGSDLNDMAERITKTIIEHLLSPAHQKYSMLRDYGEAKKYLFIRLVNIDKPNVRENAVYRLVPGGDIAEVAYIYFGDCGNKSVGSVMVTHTLIETWGMEGREHEVIEEAIANSSKLFQPRLFSFEKMLTNPSYSGDKVSKAFVDSLGSSPMICLSNNTRINGASAFFMDGVAKKLSEIFGSGLYAVPTSVHEVMIHPDNSFEAEDLRSIMQDTIQEATLDEDVLTRKYLIHYNPVRNEFACV